MRFTGKATVRSTVQNGVLTLHVSIEGEGDRGHGKETWDFALCDLVIEGSDIGRLLMGDAFGVSAKATVDDKVTNAVMVEVPA